MGKNFKRGRGKQRSTEGERHGEYTSFEQTSAKFDAYYKGQQIVPEEEWESFLAAMRAPLPTTFRITAGKPTTRQLLDAMRDIYLPFLNSVEFEGEKVTPPRQLEWYPEGLGWHLDVRKNVLRKSPEFKRFQQLLVHETDVGSISRQEAVSMLPPLFLDVKPHHLVLDMCAAPGSKTAQLIEAIHSPLTASPDAFDPMPIGAVVAKDSDTKRAHMLVHQAQRLPSPNLCVTNVDASNMPNLNVAWKSEQPDAPIRQRELRYDRILADVPCSGDGTLRKNLMIWKDWTPNNGVGLHALQLRILLRGLSLLRPGGRLVYSTCSLNPIENEAVIAAALRQCADVELADCSDMLPELKRRPGMTKWRVAPGRASHLLYKMRQEGKPGADAKPAGDAEPARGAEPDGKNGEQSQAENTASRPEIPWMDSWEQLQKLDADLASRTPQSLWTQGDEEKLHLERCMRVYPHMQNTGGFFVSCLVKKGGSGQDSDSLAPGMIRAMEALAAGAEMPSTKRPAEQAEQPEAKRAKTEQAEPEQAEPEQAEPAQAEPEQPAETATDKHRADRQAAAARKRAGEQVVIGAGGMPYREDPFAYMDPSNAEVQSCVKWFGLHGFPIENLLVRNAERVPLRSVYLTSTTVRAIVQGGGPGAGVHPTANPIRTRLLNCGVKVFGRQESTSKATQRPTADETDADARRQNLSTTLECRWRMVSDSLHSMRPFVSDKVVISATLADLAFFIKEYYPVLGSIPGDVGERLRNSPMGSYVLDVAPSEHEGHKLTVRLCYPVWRSIASANLMLDKQEKSALSYRLFDTDLSDPSGQRQFSADPQGRRKKERQERAAERRASEAAGAEGKPGAEDQAGTKDQADTKTQGEGTGSEATAPSS